MKNILSIYALAIVTLSIATIMIAVEARDQQTPLNEKELELAHLLNQYREENGLATVSVTNSLTKVARNHVKDLDTYNPDTKNYGAGDCNTHSWSNHGAWTAVCYTGSAQASQMWNKPREITESYEGNGYEVANWNSREATPQGAINEWRGSSAHSDTILQRGIFINSVWKAMGVAIDGKYAVVWFGQEEDPAGSVPTTASSEGLPDLTITAVSLGTASFMNPSEANIPLNVTIKNLGDTTNTRFKLSVDVIGPFDGYTMRAVKPFTVPGQGDIWYPWKTGLARGATYKFSGSLYLGIPHGTNLHGQTITIIPRVDSCSGEEFMPDYCRVRESNEDNNEMRRERTLR